jgi:hypothetical protein
MGAFDKYEQFLPSDIETPPTIGPEPEFELPEGVSPTFDDPEWEAFQRAQAGLTILDEFTGELEDTIIGNIDGNLNNDDDWLNKAKDSLVSLIPDIPGFDWEEFKEDIFLWIDRQITALDDKTSLDIRKIQEDLDEYVEGIADDLVRVSSKVISTTDEIIDAVGDKYEDISQTVQDNIAEYAKTVEEFAQPALSFIQESLPQQITELKDSLAEGISAIPDIPSAIGDALTSGLDTVFEKLGFNDLLGLFQMLGSGVSNLKEGLEGEDLFSVSTGSWDINLPWADEKNLLRAMIPFFGQYLQLKYPAEYERIRYESNDNVRQTPLDVSSALEIWRREPGLESIARESLSKLGFSTNLQDMYSRIMHSPLPVFDNIEAYRRGFIDEEKLEYGLRKNGLSSDDIDLARSISFRLPPIQDLILFSVRGVFDVEESKRFQEFEGLPPEYEEAFIDAFGQGGGDFSSQVAEFGKVAEQQGISKEWVSAYWSSHWRLPSLRNAFEMYHRLNPEIVDAESSDLRADGFDPDEISFDRESLDRLIRSADFSGYWRPKLSAIAYRPLTRVDVRRMHKLGVLDDDAVRRSYLKLGYSPTDAGRMTQFTIAYNAEPEETQTKEVRDLTKAQILDFVENSIFTEEEAVEGLIDIGYEAESARAFVDITLADRERKLQKDAVVLVAERVTAGLIGVGDASLELDDLGIPPDTKALILRELEIKLAKRNKQPSRPELDKFLKNGIISEEAYSIGMGSLGYADEWIERFLELNRMGMLE